jgi:hypothetical protein
MAKKKLIFRIVAGVVALLVILLVAAYFSIDGIIRSRVESTTTAATGQTTTLAGANLGIFSGTLVLNGLAVSNPPEFGPSNFLELKDGNIGVQVGSLLSDTLQVPTITLDGLHITLAQSGLTNNLQEVLQQVQAARAQAAGGGTAPAAAGRKLEIGRITLHDTVITLRMQGLPGVSGGDLTVPIKEMVLEHPTNPDGRAMRLADVLAQVLLATSQAALNDPRVPEQFRKVLGGLSALGSDLPQMLQGLGQGKLDGQGASQLLQGIGGMFDQTKKAEPVPAK